MEGGSDYLLVTVIELWDALQMNSITGTVCTCIFKSSASEVISFTLLAGIVSRLLSASWDKSVALWDMNSSRNDMTVCMCIYMYRVCKTACDVCFVSSFGYCLSSAPSKTEIVYSHMHSHVYHPVECKSRFSAHVLRPLYPTPASCSHN